MRRLLPLILLTACPRPAATGGERATATDAAPTAGDAGAGPALESPVSTTSLYPVLHASPRRDSAIPVTSAARGAVAWSRPTGELRGAEVLLVGDEPLVVGAEGVVRFDGTGVERWRHDGGTTGPRAVVAGPRVYLAGTFLTWLDDPYGEVGSGTSSMSAAVDLLWRRGEEVLAVESIMPRYDTEDPPRPIPGPTLDAWLVPFAARYRSWSVSLEGLLQVPPLYLPEQDRLVLAIGDEVRVLAPGVAGEVARFAMPLWRWSRRSLPETWAVAWSADAAGVLVIQGQLDGKKVLVAVDAAGQELWRWGDAEADAWVHGQPPLRGARGRVYALTPQRALAFDGGKLAWARPAPGAARATVLADNSLLVAAGRSLLRFDAAGDRAFAVELPEEITSSPVVNAAGTVFVATTKSLVKID